MRLSKPVEQWLMRFAKWSRRRRLIPRLSWNLLGLSLLLLGLLSLEWLGIIQRRSGSLALGYFIGAICLGCSVMGFWYDRVSSRPALTPPGFLVDLLLPPDRAEDVLYNLLGRYPYWVGKHGPLKARLIFFTHSTGAIVGFWLDWVLKRANLLRLWRSS